MSHIFIIQANGNRYEGEWYEGLKFGKGCYYHLHSGQLQTGVWKNDVPSVSLMADISFRQSALHPTQYPIQPVTINCKKY